MKDANVITCNSGTGHRSSIRTGLPSVSWGALYQGIAQSKGNYTEVKDTTGFVEGLSTVDERLLNLKPAEAAKLRLVEGQGFLESIAQTVDSAIWYSDVKVNGKQFHGLAPRYNALSNANVVNGGGTGSDNTSIWFVTHGDMQTSIITPENIAAGVQREDMGRQRVLDANGNPYYVKEEKFTQHLGLVRGLALQRPHLQHRRVRRDRRTVRAQPAAAQALLQAAGPPRLQDGARRAISPGRTVIYMNRTMMEALDAESTNGRSAWTTSCASRRWKSRARKCRRGAACRSAKPTRC
jgi:hypothetical protein